MNHDLCVGSKFCMPVDFFGRLNSTSLMIIFNKLRVLLVLHLVGKWNQERSWYVSLPSLSSLTSKPMDPMATLREEHISKVALERSWVFVEDHVGVLTKLEHS